MTSDTHPPLAHGGDLAEIHRLFPGAPEPFVDLSTGINPHHYPLQALGADSFTRLPAPALAARVAALAAEAYGAPSAEHVVLAPGTQILLPLVAGLVPPGRAAILGPTYAEHARAAALAGHRVDEVTTFDAIGDAAYAVVVNPNNPDGRLLARDQMLTSHARLLVMDEAFMDVGPEGASFAGAVDGRALVVLRSFGKFYGLAGLRLGFAIAAPAMAATLRSRLGPWAASGPALAIAEIALADRAWREAMRERLAVEAARLDALLGARGFAVIGGTSLFRLVASDAAPALFDRLGRAGILVRRFERDPRLLRFGLPPDEAAWARLAAAL